MNRKLILTCIGASLVISTIFLYRDLTASRSLEHYTLERGEHGAGEQDYTLHYNTEDGKSGTLTLAIPETVYPSAEVKKELDEALLQLDQLILGNNTSLWHIDQPLNLLSEIPGTPIMVSWNSSRMDLLDYEGKLGKQIPQEGETLELYADLMLQGESVQYQRTVRVYPPVMTDFNDHLKAEIQFLNLDQQGDSYYLPDQIDGKQISWQKPLPTQGITLLFLSIFMAAALYFADRQEKHLQKERRRDRMMEDYPEIISKLLLLLSAGLSIRSSFERISKDYAENRKAFPGETHAAYEAITIACREMKNGTSERESYENLGKHCDCPAYKTLATLLSQNLKKGGNGIRELLEREAQEAFEERKRRAKIRGEKAGTQLLIPMILMLTIVLVIIIVPACLSFSV